MEPHTALDNQGEILDALLRVYFPAFLQKAFEELNGGKRIKWNWHLDAVGHQLDRIKAGEINQLLVTLPPRNLKSITISVAWVAWMLGNDPSLKFTCLSYSSNLSLDLSRKTRKIMQSDWYRRLFPRTIISRSAAPDFETTRGGGRMATSISGSVTGFGGSIIIIDDPIKADEALSDTVRATVNNWYRQTLSSRLDDKMNGAVIAVMQRLHEDDLAGTILEEGGWQHLNLPGEAEEEERIPLTRGRWHHRRVGDVLHPEREPLSVLVRLKSKLGSQAYSAQVQQRPIPAAGNMVKSVWLRRYQEVPTKAGNDRIIQAWDTATKDGIDNDYTVCLTVLERGRDVYLLDVRREKLTAPGVLRAVISQAERYRPDAILIEDAASGAVILQLLQEQLPTGIAPPIACKAIDDKKTRFGPALVAIEAGRLFLPREADWLGVFEHELLGFPNAKHDDQVDALSHLMTWLSRPRVEDYESDGGFEYCYIDEYGRTRWVSAETIEEDIREGRRPPLANDDDDDF